MLMAPNFASNFLIFAQGFSKLKKNRGKIITKLWKMITTWSPKAKIRKSEASFVDLPFFYYSAKTVSVYRNILKS